MATFLWSTLAGRSTNAFNAATDILSFDDGSISARDKDLITRTGNDVVFSVDGNGIPALDKTVHFMITGGDRALTDANITCLNGLKMLIGDNTQSVGSGTFDDATNSLTGTAGRDLLAGLGGEGSLQS